MANPPQQVLPIKGFNFNVQTKSFQKIKRQIKPLDLLLFHGESIQSRAILLAETITLGHKIPLFSHAALVVTKELLPDVPQLEDGKLYVWECTAGDSQTCLDFKATDIEFPDTGSVGNQIRDFEVVLQYCEHINETVAWCPLINNPWKKHQSQRKRICKKLCDFHKSYGNAGYDFNLVDLLGAVFHSPRSFRNAVDSAIARLLKFVHCHHGNAYKVDKKNPLRKFFCSELVACVYQLVGVLPATYDCRNYSPMSPLGLGTRMPALTKQIVYLTV